jgi:hypothetical protein
LIYLRSPIQLCADEIVDLAIHSALFSVVQNDEERIMLCRGSSVFPGEVSGQAYMWEAEKAPPRGCVIIADFLSNEVALQAIEHQAVGIVTQRGSFATHGANLLRAASRGGKTRPIWITDASNITRVVENGETLNLFPDGSISNRLSNSLSQNSRPLRYLTPSPSRDIVQMFTRTFCLFRCYWPHRQYDIFTASIMMSGLSESVRDLCGHPCSLKLDDQGRIWFSDTAPSTDKIASLATDPCGAQSYFAKQVFVYKNILSSLRLLNINAPDKVNLLRGVVDLLKQYFSVFLLYHATYESVFSRAFSRLLECGYSTDTIDFIADSILCSRLNVWQVSQNLLLKNSKDLFSETRIVPLPEFSIDDDLESNKPVVAMLMNRLKTNSSGSLNYETRRYLQYAADVFVLKEWKFVVNKLLFTRFGWAANSILTNQKIPQCLDSIEKWRLFSFEDVDTRLKGNA